MAPSNTVPGHSRYQINICWINEKIQTAHCKVCTKTGQQAFLSNELEIKKKAVNFISHESIHYGNLGKSLQIRVPYLRS